MADPHWERMDALSGAIARLLKRIDEIDSRLLRIEAELRLERAPTPEPPVVEESPAPELPASEPPPPQPPPSKPEPVDAAPPPSPKPQLETRIGLAWANRVGAITVVLAVAFAFKYAVDNDWIGPAGRVMLGVLTGFGALAFADRLWRGDHKTYAQGICGGGVSILYLSYYAAFGFYHLVDPALAFVLMVSAVAMGGALALRYDAMPIAALALAGGCATPLLLSTGEDRPWVLFGYLLLLDVGALAVARHRGWKHLESLAAAGTLLLFGIWFADRFSAAKRAPAALFSVLFYALFATSPLQMIVIVAQAAAMFVTAPLWSKEPSGFVPTSLALAAAGLAVADRRQWPALSSVTFTMFWIMYWAWVSEYRRSDAPLGACMVLLTAGFLLFLAWLPWRMLIRKIALARQDFLLFAMNGALYFGSAYALLERDNHAWLGLFAVAVAAVHLAIAYYLWQSMPAGSRDPRPVLLALGVALCFLTLAAPIQFTGYRITLAWALEGAALTWIALRFASVRMQWAALAVFVLVLVRLHGIDSWVYPDARSYSAAVNARFLTFAVSALAMWASAWWIQAGPRALAVYVAGHFVMLWGLGLEVAGWSERTAAPGNLVSFQSASISILMAVYAVLLIAGGVVKQSALNRLLGLGLIAIVFGKLYLLDVWMMSWFFRIVAFGVLGALLLLTSYLYSRYRTSIESWWKKDHA
jgi:hypothetical protein